MHFYIRTALLANVANVMNSTETEAYTSYRFAVCNPSFNGLFVIYVTDSEEMAVRMVSKLNGGESGTGNFWSNEQTP